MLSQGTGVSFGGTAYTVTRVSVNLQSQISQRPKISTAHLGTSIDSEEPFVLGFKVRAIDSPSQVEIEFLGASAPSVGASGSLSVSGGASYSGNATCVSSVVTATTGELIKGTAVFRIASPD